MKTFTMLLLVAVLIINAVIAQQVYPKQNVTINNPVALKKIADLKMANPLSRLSLPLVYFNTQEQNLKSASTIKLDSIVISTHYPDANNWQTVDKQLFFYDSENRLVKIEASGGIISAFPEIVEFVYNALGLVDSVKFLLKQDESYVMLALNNFVYDDVGRIFQATSYYKDWDINFKFYDKWSIMYRLTYSYNEVGQPVDLLMEDGWIKEGLMVPSYHHLTYNNYGQLINYRATSLYDYEINYEWDADGNLVKESFEDFGWNDKQYSLYLYDTNSNRIKTYKYHKYSDFNDFMLTDEEEYEYFLDLNFSDLTDLHFSYLMTTNEPDLAGYCPKNLISSVLKDGKKYEYFYTPVFYDPQSIIGDESIITGIPDKPSSDFKFYPNPVFETITFNWKDKSNSLMLKIYKINGAIVHEQTILSGKEISISDLEDAIYLFKLIDGQKVIYSGKIIRR